MTYLATFHTHFDAMNYIRFLKKKGIAGALKPVPRRVSSSCGTCAVFDTSQEIETADLTQEEVAGLYLVEDGRHTQIYAQQDEA